MHIPDGVLSPTATALTAAIGVGGLAIAVRRLQAMKRERTTVLMGIMAAFVFAAQMVNFPLYPFPISGHLMGGVLASVMLGPWAGAGVIAIVLIVQCLLAGDGGVLALGANFVNMGLIGSLAGYAIYASIRRAIGGRRGIVVGAMAGAWFSVILGSAAFALELAASGRPSDFLEVLGWMTLVHAGIGLGEAIITGLAVRSVLQIQPGLIEDLDADEPLSVPRRRLQLGFAGLAIALAVAIFLGPLASGHADGLEYVGTKLDFIGEGETPPIVKAPLPDYEVPGLGDNKALATAGAGLVGTLVVFAVALGLARGVAGRRFASGKVGVDAV